MVSGNEEKETLRVVVSKKVKNDIIKKVEKKEYKSISDFLRRSISVSLYEKKNEKTDILKEKEIKQFIERIS